MAQVARKKYRIRNWKQYNKALIQRGSITLWFSQDAIDKWHATTTTGKKGHPQIYSDDAILCALLIRTIYQLPLRAVQGLLISLAALMKLPIKIPSYTQICRRAKDLNQVMKKLSARRPSQIVFDSTGLKVYGEGEWKVRKHGASKRRTWRKFHIGMDPKSGEVVICELTENGVGSGDAEIGKRLVKKLPRSVKSIYGDGAYDDIGFRRAVEDAGAQPIVPPPRNARLSKGTDPAITQRNDAVKQIRGLGGDEEARALWKKLIGYHTRSLGETMMYRIKQLTGSSLRSRSFDRQRTEAYVKCLVINKMTKLGMPSGKWIDAA
jgi:ribosomal protein S8E